MIYTMPILAETVDPSVYTLSFCEHFAFQLFHIACSKVCYMLDPLWGLSLWHVGSYQLQFWSSVDFERVPKPLGAQYVHDGEIR